jgi:hypothetical protein
MCDLVNVEERKKFVDEIQITGHIECGDDDGGNGGGRKRE